MRKRRRVRKTRERDTQGSKRERGFNERDRRTRNTEERERVREMREKHGSAMEADQRERDIGV